MELSTNFEKSVNTRLGQALKWVKERKRDMENGQLEEQSKQQEEGLEVCDVCGREMSPKGLRLHRSRMHGIKKEKKEKETSQVVFLQPEQELPQVPSVLPVPTVPSVPLVSIPLGTILSLEGVFWCQNPATLAWQEEEARKLTVTVISKTVPVDKILLLCKAENSQACWAIREEVVILGEIQILKLGVVNGDKADKPFDGVQVDEYFLERQREEQEKQAQKDRLAYGDAVQAYAEAKMRRKAAEEKFKEVDNSKRPLIYNYVQTYGNPSAPGEEDWVVLDFDCKAHIIRTVGRSYIERDEAKIVEFLLANGHSECLKPVVNVEKWDQLKKDGKVPAEFIRSVEKPAKEDDNLSLRVDPIQ